MSSKKRKKGHLPPFVPVIRTTMALPVWKQLSFGARCLYVVLRSYLRADNLNNGKVYRSYRDAANDLGTKSLRSVQRWFRELEHYGFVVQTTGACLGVDGDGVAAHWRITECASFDAKGNQIAPTRDFERWDGTLFDDPDKTESRIPKGNTPLPKGIHTDGSKPDRKRSKRYPKGNIDSAPSMLPKGIHNCLPPPVRIKEHCDELRSIDELRIAERKPLTGYQQMLRAIDAAGPEYLAKFGITLEGWNRWRRGEHGTAAGGRLTGKLWSTPTLIEISPDLVDGRARHDH